MASPRENTELFRMVKDVKDALYFKGTPASISKRNLSVYRPNLSRNLSIGSTVSSVASRNLSKASSTASSVATKLDFSFLEDSTSSFPGISNSFECNSLKRKLQNAEAELLVAKAKVKDKEGAISLLGPANKKVCLDLQNDLENCKRQNELEHEKVIDLKAQIKRLSNEIDAKNRLIESEKQRKIESEKKDLQITALKIECNKFKSEIDEAKSEKAESVRKLNSQIGSLELELSSATDEIEQSKEYIQVLEKQLQEQTAKSALATQLQKELNNSEMKIKSLESKLEADKEASLKAQTMLSELKILPELRKENQQLKEELRKHRDSNAILLQEKIWNLQEKLNQADTKSILLARIQAENEQLKEKIAEWELLMDDKEKPGYKSPSTFSRRLSEYQKNEVILTNKIAKLTSHCRNLNSMKTKLESTVAELNKENTKMKQIIPDYENKLKLCRKKIFVLSKEQEGCRKLIDSYVNASSETSFYGSPNNVQYVKTLEETLAAYKDMLEKAENDVKDMEQQFKSDTEKSNTDVDSAEFTQKLREENAELLLKIEEVQAEKLLLEERLSHEEQLPKSTERSFKIVHMRHNPLEVAMQERIAEHRRLQEENDMLRKRIKVLEEEGAKAENVTMKVQAKLAEEGSSETIQGMTKKLNEAEKKCEIQKKQFHKASQVLREACYMLNGYKIEMVNNTYKLYHMYADSPDDCLIFQLSDEGNLSLFQNEYTANLKERIDTYLLRYDSIPAFLASITLDLFNQQTCVIMDED